MGTGGFHTHGGCPVTSLSVLRATGAVVRIHESCKFQVNDADISAFSVGAEEFSEIVQRY
jgi:hypothetical protein